MKEKDLPIDCARYAVYTKKAKECVLRLLHRDYDDRTCRELWEKIQLQYCEYVREEPPMAGAKIRVIIYDPILFFAWYKVVPDKPGLEDVQQDIYQCFMGSFDVWAKSSTSTADWIIALRAGFFRWPMTSGSGRLNAFRDHSGWVPVRMTERTA